MACDRSMDTAVALPVNAKQEARDDPTPTSDPNTAEELMEGVSVQGLMRQVEDELQRKNADIAEIERRETELATKKAELARREAELANVVQA